MIHVYDVASEGRWWVDVDPNFEELEEKKNSALK